MVVRIVGLDDLTIQRRDLDVKPLLAAGVLERHITASLVGERDRGDQRFVEQVGTAGERQIDLDLRRGVSGEIEEQQAQPEQAAG